MPAIKSRTTSATVWTVAGFGASQGLRLAGNLVLARLLIPEDFGTMALIAILMQGLVMFSDVGIGPSIIRSARGNDPDFLNTAWTIQAARGLALWICACALAIPFAGFYNEPKFEILVPVACLNVFILGFISTALFTENRALNLGRITSIEVVSQIAGLTVMVSWAFAAPTVWALIAGGIVSSTAKMLLSHLMFPSKRNCFRWDRSAVSELVKFGKWIFLSTALGFTSGQIDRIVLGKLVPLDLLGLYSIAFMWANAPYQLTLAWSSKVFFPLASKAILTGVDTEKDRLMAYRKDLLLIAAPLIAGLIIAMPKLIKLLYLPTFEEAGPVGSILAVGVWVGMLSSTYGAINMAGGKPHYISIAAGAKVVLFISLVIPFYGSWGVLGVAAAVIVSQAGPYIVSATGVFRSGFSSIVHDLSFSAILIAVSYLVFALNRYAEKTYHSLIIDLVVICGISGAISAIFFAIIWIKSLRRKSPSGA